MFFLWVIDCSRDAIFCSTVGNVVLFLLLLVMLTLMMELLKDLAAPQTPLLRPGSSPSGPPVLNFSECGYCRIGKCIYYFRTSKPKGLEVYTIVEAGDPKTWKVYKFRN